MRLTEADLARLGADSEGRRKFARDPDRHVSASRPGATAGQHAQAAAPAVKAVATSGVHRDGDVCAPRHTEQRSAAPDPMLAMGEPPAVEEQNATGSYRRAGVALRTPEATGESGPQRPTKVVEIALSNGMTAIVDEDDAAEIRKHKWRALNNGHTIYAIRTEQVGGVKKTVLMHRQITRAANGLVVDHKDRNTLNNCRSNLRVCTRRDNQGNRKTRKDATFGLKGVHASHDRFSARIGVGGKEIHLGCFDTPEQAHAAYCEAAVKYFGEFARSA